MSEDQPDDIQIIDFDVEKKKTKKKKTTKAKTTGKSKLGKTKSLTYYIRGCSRPRRS